LGDVHEFIAPLTPFVLDMFPFVHFVSVCLYHVSLSISLCFVCVVLALLRCAF